jgi:glucose/arabinose dehydrogenase
VLTVPHPVNPNHNGGALAFGPRDGYLYIALGDGGGANDPAGNGQNRDDLLGSVLRADVDRDAFPSDPARNYANPSDNPFVGGPGADEIWAYGLRNPWRISFDTNGDLYIADVGQSAREEVNFLPASSHGGVNYGWDLAEGTLGTPPPGAIPPIFEYGHDLGQSITGGYVYRGAEAALQGS